MAASLDISLFSDKKVSPRRDRNHNFNVHFLCPHKKRTKESGWGEALTAKSFMTALANRRFYPNFEPPSPQTSLPAPIGG